jgi:hypothetical protein
MAKGARKVKRAQAKQLEGPKSKKGSLAPPAAAQPVQVPDPLSSDNIKQMLPRLGLPVIAVWLIGAFVASLATSGTTKTIAIAVPAALTAALAGVLVYVVRQAKKARGVAGILQGASDAEGRQAALEQLDAGYKKNDPAAVFAKAQLLMQEDPQKALEVLETIDLSKVMAQVADEARAQRAMIHLMLGQPKSARDLVDDIDMSRHQDPKTRAMMGAVVGEAWARTGQAKKGVETLELFDPEDEALEPIRPQLYRAQAFAYAYTSETKKMRRALKKLVDQDPRLLGGFLVKKSHPLLQKEARQMLERSGAMPRKMMVQRR